MKFTQIEVGKIDGDSYYNVRFSSHFDTLDHANKFANYLRETIELYQRDTKDDYSK